MTEETKTLHKPAKCLTAGFATEIWAGHRLLWGIELTEIRATAPSGEQWVALHFSHQEFPALPALPKGEFLWGSRFRIPEAGRGEDP